jgi:SAM-dependent methyltransferase
MSKTYLDKAYGAKGAEATRKLYDEWSASYDTELEHNGYATPRRCAEALAQFCTDPAAPILDFGCGTGLSGLALKEAGFETIDGVDVSAEMLAQAEDKRCYRSTDVIRPGAKLSHKPGDYSAIAAIGVIGAGAAPIETFDLLMHGLGKGDFLVLSLNDHALEDPVNEARLNEWLDCGAGRLLFCERGDHIPGIGLEAKVYVIEKT